MSSDIEAVVAGGISMFCHQCSRARPLSDGGRACISDQGVCGKDANLQALFDNLESGIFSLSTILIQYLREDGYLPENWIVPLLNSLAVSLTDTSFESSFIFDHLVALKSVFEQAKNSMYTRGIPFSANMQFIDSEWDPEVSNINTAINKGRSIRPINALIGKGATGSLYDVMLFSCRYIAAVVLRLMRLGSGASSSKAAHSLVHILSDLPAALHRGSESHCLRLVRDTSLAIRDVLEALDTIQGRKFGDLSVEAVTHKKQAFFNVPLIDPSLIHTTPTIVVSGNDYADLSTVLRFSERYQVDVVTSGDLLSAHRHRYFRQYSSLKGHLLVNVGDERVLPLLTALGGAILTTGAPVPPALPLIEHPPLFCVNETSTPGSHRPLITPSGLLDFEPMMVSARHYSPHLSPSPLLRDQSLVLKPRIPHFTSLVSITGIVTELTDALVNAPHQLLFCVGEAPTSGPGAVYLSNLIDNLPDSWYVLAVGPVRIPLLTAFHGRQLGSLPKVLDGGSISCLNQSIRTLAAVARSLNTDISDSVLFKSVCLYHSEQSLAATLALTSAGISNLVVAPLPPCLNEASVNVLEHSLLIRRGTNPVDDFDWKTLPFEMFTSASGIMSS
ncbi:hypothetical protein RCL1_005102 [Eukaryota sp. TZLM3-RCL]